MIQYFGDNGKMQEDNKTTFGNENRLALEQSSSTNEYH